jgi:hypothetical protein
MPVDLIHRLSECPFLLHGIDPNKRTGNCCLRIAHLGKLLQYVVKFGSMVRLERNLDLGLYYCRALFAMKRGNSSDSILFLLVSM